MAKYHEINIFRQTRSFMSRTASKDATDLKVLRTVPTFVSAHTFGASRKQWFKRAKAGVDIDAINYATKYTFKIKAKLSYCDPITFNELLLKP